MENKDFIKELKEIIQDNKEFKGANKSLYTFISSNYYNLSKEQLKELVLNLDYIIYNMLEEENYLELENKALEETIERI